MVARKVKMLIVPCSSEETSALASDIHRRLKDDYDLGDAVELCLSSKRAEIMPGTPKNHTHPLVIDYFDNMEVQADIGSNPLRDEVQGKHVVLVEHMQTPARLVNGNTVSVNDHVAVVRGFMDICSRVAVPQLTLSAPFLPYIRSHSVKKYQARGFEQYDSLRKMLKDFSDDGLKAIVTIDAHSDYAIQLAEEFGIDFHNINPFQSSRTINPRKLGLTGEKAKKVLASLKPFQGRFQELVHQYGEHVYLVSVDNGAEKRAESFAERAFSVIEDSEQIFAHLVYLDKDRVSYNGKIVTFKHFSQINADNIDPDGVYIMVDDMIASGSTVRDVAKLLKNPGPSKKGAKIVEAWASHPVTMQHQYGRANERSLIDKIVCIDTIPHGKGLEVEYVGASAGLLAAELYKVHEKKFGRKDA